MTYQFEVCALASLKLDGLWLGGPASMAFAAAEKAIPCAMQLLGSKIMLAGSDVHRERAKEYLSFVQQSRKDIEEVPGLRGGGRLSVTDADMREDVLPVLLPEEAARCLSLERIAEIQRATRTFLVFDTGGGSVMARGMRRLLVCGGTEVRRAEAAARARERTVQGNRHLVNSLQESEVENMPPSDPWAKLLTIPWPKNINEWGRLQRTLWSGHPKLKKGWIRCMSSSQRQEYYVRVADGISTFDPNEALA
ncbi:unnamed protein product [Durusdinium trenchii]|uniref:Uncharacterized protein n=2 Tax=Durusdinium trenchii TaxID=1381693 RepID=A0ABP0SG82_9DINO